MTIMVNARITFEKMIFCCSYSIRSSHCKFPTKLDRKIVDVHVPAKNSAAYKNEKQVLNKYLQYVDKCRFLNFTLSFIHKHKSFDKE